MKFSFFIAADVPCQLRLLIVSGCHREKHIKAQSVKSSKSVVNSILISREMPVFQGFFEIVERFYLKTSQILYMNAHIIYELPTYIL